MLDKDIEFNSRKFLALLSLICIVFFMIVMKAFDYIPKNNNQELTEDSLPIAHNAVIPSESKEEQTEEAVNNDEEKPVIEIKQVEKSETGIDEIDAPPGVNPQKESALISSGEDSVSQGTSNNPVIFLYNANNLKRDKKYNDALNEYQKVLEKTDDKELKASAYEGISTVYAVNRRYGTALSFALKAYNIAPNSARALLAAQLYNKTGETQRASQIVNKLLQDEIK